MYGEHFERQGGSAHQPLPDHRFTLEGLLPGNISRERGHVVNNMKTK